MSLTKHELEELTNFVENGPIDVGSCICHDTVLSLLQKGLLARIIIKGDDGCLAATMKGAQAYKDAYGTMLGGKADTIGEAYANRLMMKAMKGMV